MQEPDRKLAWAGIVVGAIWALELAWGLFIGPADHHANYDSICEKNCGIPWWDSATAWNIALSGILAGSTILLWLSTRKSTRIAERALTELERPFLYIEVSEPGMSFHDLSGAEGFTTGVLELSFFNYGRTPAHLTRIAYEIDTAPRGSIVPAIDARTVGGREVPYGTVSVAEGPYTERENLRLKFWNEREEIERFEKSVWITGFARYRDIFGNHYITGFTQVFAFVGERFVRRGGEQYNYGRSEKAEEVPPPSSMG